jgi:putative redox protein
MVRIQLEYQGELHCNATHEPSGKQLTTDAPKDNHGRGESFSPTDLVATALGSCMLTIMGIVANTHGIDISGATASVEKEMSSTAPRRIARLAVKIQVPRPVSPEDRKRLENGVHTCPVHKSLHPGIEIPVEFVWAS